MAIDFPNSPTLNETYTVGNITWTYDGTKWKIDSVSGGGTVNLSDANPVMNGTVSPGDNTLASRDDHIHPSDTSKASLDSPSFTGTPTVPTPSTASNNSVIVNAEWIVNQGYLKSSDAALNYQPLSTELSAIRELDGTTLSGFLYRTEGDGYSINTTAYAPLSSPTFTGTPAAPTASADTNTTQIATTAYVIGQGYLKSTDAASTYLTQSNASSTYLTTSTAASTYLSLSTAASTYSPLSSPTFSGTPSAPTASTDTNTTQIATTAFVIGQGYLKSSTASSTYQPVDPDLTAIASLTGTGILKRTGTNTWVLDSSTGLTQAEADLLYQPLDGDLTTISGLTGTGFLYKDGANAWSLGDISAYLTVADAATTYETISHAASTYLTQSAASSGYQPLDADLTTIAGLTGTGWLKRTGTNTWTFDNPSDYLTTANASSTYLTISNASSTYLTSATAASTYLSSATAATTYAPIASPTFTGTVTSTYQNLIPTASRPTWTEGNLYYDSEEKTVIIQGNGTSFEIAVGQREWVRCRNSSGATIPKGSVVYVTGVHIPGDPVHGHHPTIALADASNINKIDVVGITGEDIANGSHGYVVVRGYIEGLNTSNLTSASRIHLSATTAGGIVDTAPDYPNYPIDLGICLTSDSTNGTIYVDVVQHSFEGFRVTNNGYIDGNLTVGGNLSILGTSSSISASNLAVSNNFIYLNSGDTIGDAGTTFTGSGLDDATFVGHYTGTTTKTFKVKIVSTSPDKFRWSTDNFSTDNGSDITIIAGTPQLLSDNISIVFVSATGHTINNTWSGTAAPVNIDLALIGNRNTGTSGVGYTHTGFFFDVSDAKFKLFDTYYPEPNLNIDIADPSFSLGSLVAETFEGDLIGNVTGFVTGSISGNANTVTNGVYTTGSYSNPSWITSLAWSKISSTPTTLSGYGITDAQPLDADLTAIAALSGTSGLLKKTAADTWTLDTNTYLTSSTGVTSVNGNTGAVTGLAELAGAAFTGLISSSKNAPAVNLNGSPSSTATTNALLNVGTSSWSDTDIIASFTHTVNSYAQVVVQNKSAGSSASADVVLSNDTGSASANYVDLGINSSAFSGGGAWDDPNGGYLYGNGGSFTVGTQGSNDLRFATGNTIRATIDSSGTFTIPTNASGTVNALTLSGSPSSSAVSRGLLRVGMLTGYSDSNMIASFVQDTNDFTQILVQNKNAGSSASSDIIIANNASTANTNYLDIGMNSSAYSGSTPWDTAGGGYFYANGGTLTIGTQGSNALNFVTGNTNRASIDSNGNFTIPTNHSPSTNALALTGTVSTSPTGMGLLQVGGTTSFNDNNTIASFVHSATGYAQVTFQNKTASTTSSMDLVVNADNSTATTIYGDFGINSSAYTGVTAFDVANDVYLFAHTANLTVGTRTAHTFKIATNNTLRITVADSSTTITNRVLLSNSLTTPAINIGYFGSAPATLANGDIWTTASGLFAQINGVTEQYAKLNSPSFTTPNIGTATGTSFNGITGFTATAPLVNGTAAVGSGTTVAYGNHVHPTDTTRAPLASPTFTGKVTTAASSTSAGFSIPHGTALTNVTSVAGDIWTTTTGMFANINGTVVGPFAASGGTVSLSAANTWTASNTFSLSTIASSPAVPAVYLSGTPKLGGSLNMSTGLLQVGPINTGLADTNIVGVFNVPVNDYSQTLFINGNTGTAASVDICFYNDQTLLKGGLGSYGDIGLASSTYTTNTGWPSFSDPGGMYIYMQGGSLSIGTQHVGDTAPTSYNNDFMINTDDLTRVTLGGGRSGGTSYWTFESTLTGVQVNTTLFSSTLRTLATTTASTNSSAITIQSGNATGTTSSSGSITVDTGTGTTAAGTVLIGNTNAPTVTIGRTTGTGNTTAGTVTAYPAAGTATATGSYAAGYIGMPQMLNPQTTNAYTFVASDAGKHIYLTTGTNNALTIPANGTTAFPIGTTIVVVNKSGTSATIAITTDTLTFAGTGTTGTRTLSNFGVATLLKVSATEWFISGNGVI